MTKQIKTALLVVGAATLAYLILKPSAVVAPLAAPALSDAEKQMLFNTAYGYRGGAAPPQELMDALNKAAADAQAKIAALGLTSEYQAYALQQSQLQHA
jgi:hypothetical protein